MFKESIMNLKTYHPQQEACRIRLDANESYVNKPYNRYPDPTATRLRKKIADKEGVNPEEIIAGNGSSELIDLLMKCTLSQGGKLLTFGPTFSIYEMNATIMGGDTITYPLNKDFSLDVQGFIEKCQRENPQLIILCNPNNPTGTLLSKKDISTIIGATSTLVIIDEAYIDFGGESMIDLINNYENLVVLKTLSKAYGLAGVRLGYMVSSKKIIDVVNKVRPPYNLSSVAQEIGLQALDKEVEMKEIINKIIVDRNVLSQTISQYTQVFPSGGNFIFFKSTVDKLYEALLEKDIRIRQYSGHLSGYYRVTVGTTAENKAFVEALEEIYGN